MTDAIPSEAIEFPLGPELDRLADQRRRWREAGASADEIARWSAAWLSRPSTNPRRAQCR